MYKKIVPVRSMKLYVHHRMLYKVNVKKLSLYDP